MVIDTWCDWKFDPKTGEDSFYKYTKYSNNTISAEPVSREDYLDAKQW